MRSSRIMRGVLGAGVVVTLAVTISSVGRPTPVRLSRVVARRHDPVRIHRQRNNGSWDSTNWSGYAVTGSNVTDVKGSWVVPAVTCPPAPTGYSSFWVGIDGFSSNTVEQIGTDSDCESLSGKSNTATYYAWFEFYPQYAYVIQFSRGIKVGDVITAEVKYAGQGSGRGRQGSGPQFTVTITDVTQNESYTTTSAVRGAQQTSAEWIAEAPCCGSGNTVLPLADFGSVAFSSGNATTAQNTKGGPIGSFGANVQEITMVGESNSTLVKAQPSSASLSSTATGFSVAWLAAGP